MKRALRRICVYLPDRFVMQIDNIRTYGRLLDLKNPEYYGEKIQWIKANGNLEKYKDLVDKYLVREYIKSEIGEEYLPKLIGVYDREDEIDYSKLPKKFALKLNDGSDRNIICRNKDLLDIKKTNKRLRKLLEEDYYKYTKEPQYKGIKKKIVCEEYLEDKNGALVEYNLHCFSGKVRLIEVHTDRLIDYKEDYFEVDWTRLNVRGKVQNSSKEIERPKFLEKLIILGEALAKNFEYVRVDFNAVDEKLYFSELTFTPANGTDRFTPLDYDLKIAGLINLDKYNKPFEHEDSLLDRRDENS